jgi:hypothetical protein
VFDTQRTILIDLDGCLVANPADSFARGTIQDPMYWHNHWNDPDSATPQWEIVRLARAYMDMGYEVIVLTARPDSYMRQTQQFLDAVGLHDITLMMRPADHGITASALWKVDKILELMAVGRKIDFMIEDYPSNAEQIRKVLPVLLYERVK